MSKEEDVTRARQALITLSRATSALQQHFGDSLDARRLALGVARVAEDLEALCGPETPPEPPPPAPKRMVIDDTAYAHDFWMDAEDEGLGASYRQR